MTHSVTSHVDSRDLMLVTCVSQLEILQQRLLSSPCLQRGKLSLVAHFNCSSAAQAFNMAMASPQAAKWMVWVHQDVVLPLGWDLAFVRALNAAEQQFARLAVVGVYGVAGTGASLRRAGHVLDRGRLLHETTPLPCLVDSVDELLFAVRSSSGLRLDAALGFDFYGTDVVLQAQQAGWQSAVVDAYCEHWSDTPSQGNVAQQVLNRIVANADVFEHKWRHRLPVSTPCFDIAQPGDVKAFTEAIKAMAL